jgi:hypothetical protein
MLDRLALDTVTFGQDVFGRAEAGARQRHVIAALMIAAMIVTPSHPFLVSLLFPEYLEVAQGFYFNRLSRI